MDGLVFGWRTAILALVVAQLLAIACGLSRTLANHVANRTLAALLVVLAGVLTPWMIGFAGFYDRWRWLTFAPFAITLAVAPLSWLYVRALIDGRWPDARWRHLIPAALQATYLISGFLLPIAAKQRWADASMAVAAATTGIGTVIGIAAYGTASLRSLARYRLRLAAERSDDARFAAPWLSRAIGASFALLPIWAIYAVWDAIAPLGYFRLMGLHVAIATFALYLAIEGWRHAALPFPHFVDAPTPAVPMRDWQAIGEDWADRVRTAGWASDPDLSLASLARHLGTNKAYLSRALNDGLGTSFSSFINDIRSQSVAAAVRAGDRRGLLDLALEAGFASKASFNRAFAKSLSMSPSQYRRSVSNPEPARALPAIRDRNEAGS